MNSINGFLISAPQSGSGKTTVSLAIMAAFSRRGFCVAPFKCGPDFIDTGYHRAVTGHFSINLDLWMCPENFVKKTFFTHILKTEKTVDKTKTHLIALVEGAMGLFDGIGAASMEGSSAQIASAIGSSVILVVNARGMAASVAALVNGFASFDKSIRISGVIFNNVGSDSHANLLKEAVAAYSPKITCFGCIPRDDSMTIPSRHLGLITAEDNPLSDDFIDKLADVAERYLDLDGLAQLQISLPADFRDFATLRNISVLSKEKIKKVSIAVARDCAFCFMYEDNLRLLREAGAELTFFSPLVDKSIPADIQGIYLPGGYPELYATKLAENLPMIESIKVAVNSGMPVYAECGGFIYLTEGIVASDEQVASNFVGIFPLRCKMLSHRKALGYRNVELIQNSIIGKSGSVMRGHEFHYSEICEKPSGIENCFYISRLGVSLGEEGYFVRNCLASYVHLHFGSNPEIANTFIEESHKWGMGDCSAKNSDDR